MKRLLLILVIISFLFIGCAKPTIKPEKLSSMKNIGVVSLLGTDICNIYIGTTIFTNKQFSSDTAIWNIDKTVQQEVGDLIYKDGRYNYVEIPISYSSTMNIYEKRNDKCIKKKSYDIQLVKNDIEKMRNQFNIDTLIFILEGYALTNYYIDSRSGYLMGCGLYRSSFMGLNSTVSHAFADIVVVDTNTIEELSKISANGFERIDNKYWNEGFDSLSPDDKLFVENSIKKTLKSSLQAALNKINIIK